MKDMVERVAVALANYDADLVDVPHIGSLREFRFDRDRDEYVRRARAAIDAMREPDEAMLSAQVSAHVPDYRHAVWQAMIEAALSQSGEG